MRGHLQRFRRRQGSWRLRQKGWQILDETDSVSKGKNLTLSPLRGHFWSFFAIWSFSKKSVFIDLSRLWSNLREHNSIRLPNRKWKGQQKRERRRERKAFLAEDSDSYRIRSSPRLMQNLPSANPQRGRFRGRLVLSAATLERENTESRDLMIEPRIWLVALSAPSFSIFK